MTGPGKSPLFAAALHHTIVALAPSQHLYRVALSAIADDIRAMGEGLLRPEIHEQIWDDLPWTHFRGGIDQIALSCPTGGETNAALLRYRAGASVPHHLHVGNEHIIVLAGSQQDARGRYRRGAVICNAAGTAHSVLSPEGCVVGVFWEKPVRFLAGWKQDPRDPSRQEH